MVRCQLIKRAHRFIQCFVENTPVDASIKTLREFFPVEVNALEQVFHCGKHIFDIIIGLFFWNIKGFFFYMRVLAEITNLLAQH